jgi:DNA-binding beta-propeller fold protein YncE
VLAGTALAVIFPPLVATNTGSPVSRKVSDLVYPAQLLSEIGHPTGGDWLLPAGVVQVGESTFVLDTGNNRILRLDSDGRLLETLDPSRDAHLDLQQPMAMATDGARLYIANSLASEVLVLGESGGVQMSIALKGQEGDRAPRPIGIAARSDGSMVVSDAENQRVLFLSSDGTLVKAVGSGLRSGGREGFNVPGAITLDAAGNSYIVDTLNGRIVKLSPDGTYLGDYGRLADTAGSLARPKGVAVDGAGRVFVSDGLQAAIEVFSANGAYLGVIGRRDPGDGKAGSIFEAPWALWLSGNRLTVIDSIVGLVTLGIPEPAVQQSAGTH